MASNTAGTEADQSLLRTNTKPTLAGSVSLWCALVEEVRTELLKSPIIPYIPNLLALTK